MKFQDNRSTGITNRSPRVSRARERTPHHLSLFFSFFFFALPFVTDTRAKRISIRPLGDAIYLQLVPRLPRVVGQSSFLERRMYKILYLTLSFHFFYIFGSEIERISKV